VSREQLESVRALIPPDGTDLVDTFGAPGDVSAGGLVADDVPVRFVSPSAEMAGAGPEGFYERWADWLEPWESYRIYTEELVERGERVVALVRLVGVTKRDQVEMEHQSAAVFRFEGDRIAEIVFTMEREAALDD
jgi:ketosteroid isomerase-like protein